MMINFKKIVSMPFKTGKGTAGEKKHIPYAPEDLVFQCPLRRARVLRGYGGKFDE